MQMRPTQPRLLLLDAFVRSVSDVLEKLDGLWIPAMHHVQAAKLNVVNPGSFSLTAIGAPSLVVDSGAAGDGTLSNLWDTGFIPNTHAVKATILNCEAGVFTLDNTYLSATNSMSEFGNECCLLKTLETVLVSGSPTTVGARIGRNATFRSSSGAATNSVGLTSALRDGTASTKLFRNGGTQVAVSSGAATDMGSASLTLCGANTVGASCRKVGMAYFGAGLTTTERTRLYNAVVLLLTATGAYDAVAAEAPPYTPPPADPYAPAASVVWTETYLNTALDMTGMTLTHDTTWSDSAALAKITADGGAGPWSSPVHATVGSAAFVGPDAATSPYSIQGGVLRIRCEQVAGVWQTGHIQTANSSGAGFSQTRGYFEVKLKMPAAGTKGAWPAFWLYGNALYTDPTQTRPEIDVIEYYPGGDKRGHHATVHLRPGSPYVAGRVSQHWYKGDYTGMDKIFDGNWHTYGCLITSQWIIIYMDRLELERIPLVSDFDVPLYMLVSLQLLSDEAPQAVSPIDLFVEYCRVWQ
jgi:hypothetical protein